MNQPHLSSLSRLVPLVLGALQLLIGLGAVAGSLWLISDPSGQSMGLNVALLQGSPFPDFLVPGWVLFLVNGLGNLIAAGSTFWHRRYAAEAAIALGIFLMAWIVIQAMIIGLGSWIQVLYFGLGALELLLGMWWQASNVD